ncbi:MAG: ComEC/Rec2 family competence protein [Opitutales bacterium]|nr:ComEC/Rec2 family competence protein [Opitutales bacterium]
MTDPERGSLPFNYGGRAPLVWILFPLIAGYSLATTSIIADQQTLLALIAAITALSALFTAKFSWIWKPLFLLAATSLSACWYQVRVNTLNPDWETLPPRELELSIRIENLYSTTDDTVAGIATIVEAPKIAEDLLKQKVQFQLHREKEQIPETGDLILAKGLISYRQSNPLASNSFDRYLKRQHILLQFRRGTILNHTPALSPSARFFSKAREKLESGLLRGTEAYLESGIFAAMLSGNKRLIPAAEKQAFSESGTLHLFAVSGLHVMTVSAVIFYIFHFLRIPRPATTLLCLAGTAFYVFTTGASPSALRALFIIVIYAGARLFQREPQLWPALVFSALLVLIASPDQLRAPGFQLSYAVTSAIALYGIPLTRFFREQGSLYPLIPTDSLNLFQRFTEASWRKLSGLFAISLSAFLGSIGLSVYHFETFAFSGLLLNMIVVPLAPICVTLGVFSSLCGFSGFAAGSIFFNKGAFLVLQLILGPVLYFQSITGAGTHWSFSGDLIGIFSVVVLFTANALPCVFRKGTDAGSFFIAPLFLFGIWLCAMHPV